MSEKAVFIIGGSGFIGTNCVAYFRRAGWRVVSFDLAPPLDSQHADVHVSGDIMDASSVASAMAAAAPQVVIHLAGRTDCDERTTVEEGYLSNTVGTANVLEAIKATPGIERAIITSSQYVAGPDRLPKDEFDYFPHTVYGQSKVETERLTRAADLPCCWTLIRPVNIWGPWHQRYSREFWRVVHRGLYIHPDLPAPTRTYGYVGNVVWQMARILELPVEKVNHKVLYVGDRQIPIDRWVFAFHQGIRGKDPLRIPYPVIRSLAFVGDGFSRLMGRPFYINSSRLRSMTQDYLTDMEATMDLLGEPPYSMEEGVKETVHWLREKVWV
ncbi:nucleoside-diphosphate-sugar epimerase [Haloferula luteola]|uniref:Nucleoside-diphosphate-sugar epimerase n=1 Tax=Haloferula luteola TaxID=595692 RepID=A0A840VA35_9BACT|nr:NAD(P)-dependent oxidoreductase [Haloferula luteola]MBB5350810.1 nucleoside-diphosphate-sugar epimerase [Haloferula luteola]